MLTARHDVLECQTAVASDYYGLGVRLGVYFVWLQALVANTLLPSSIPAATNTNTIFLMTLLIAMLNDTVADTLSQVDALVLMHLCSGTVFGTLSLWGYRTRLYKDHGPAAVRLYGSYGSHVRLAICLAVSVFGFWFWCWGITGRLWSMTGEIDVEPPNADECGITYTFFFAKLRADGWIRYYYMVICACCMAWFGAMVIVSGLAAVYSASHFVGSFGPRFAHSARAHTWSRPKYVTGFKTNELILIHKVLRVFNSVWLLWSALTIEFTLNFNHIIGVLGGRGNELSDPGQLLPFLVGLFGFVTTLYAVAQERLFPKPDVQENVMFSPINNSGLFSPTDSIAFGSRPMFSPTDSIAFDTRGRPTTTEAKSTRRNRRLDRQQERRSTFIRYLVGWMPWLSLLQSFDQELVQGGISRQGTDLSTTMLSPKT